MQLTGNLLIGQQSVHGSNGSIKAVNASTGAAIEPAFGGATLADLDRACALAWAVFDVYRETTPEARARFLETIAQNILDISEDLIERCMMESGLSRARLEDERGRMVGQLRMFADVVRNGDFLRRAHRSGAARAQAAAARGPASASRRRRPGRVFGASNFPLAFSVAGGDTASALAAGCPVVVKAHSAHPGTAKLVGRALQKAVKDCGMPEGTVRQRP